MEIEMVEFKDLPDTTTPITAENLNKVQTNINNVTKQLVYFSTEEEWSE